MFLHMSEWLLCPMHALGCLLMTQHYGETGHLFENLQGKEAGYMNTLFTSLYEQWDAGGSSDDQTGVETESQCRLFTREAPLTSGLTSHSSRRGSASDAHGHSQLRIDYLNDRGGWKMNTLMTIFGYLSSNRKNDGRVGRVISGRIMLIAVDYTGAPSHEPIPIEQQETVFLFLNIL